MKPNRSLIAFLLAGLTVGVLFTILNLRSIAGLRPEGLLVTTAADANIDQAVKAIEALKLKGVVATKISHLAWGFGNVVWMILAFTVLFLLITGMVLFFYKLYCRWFRAGPHL